MKAVALSLLFAAVFCPSTTEADSHPTRTLILHDHGISINVPSHWNVGEPYEGLFLAEQGISARRIDFIDPSDDVFPLTRSGCTLHHIPLQFLGPASLLVAEHLAASIVGRIDEPDTKEIITINQDGLVGSAYYERHKRLSPGIWDEAWLFFDHFDFSGTTLHALACVYSDMLLVSRLHGKVFNSIVFLRPSLP